MKITLRYLGAALSVILMLSLLTACGGQSAQSEDTEEYLTDTDSIDGFDSLESDSDADDSEPTDSESTNDNNNSSNNEENTTTGGGSGGTVDLPILPV